MKKLVDFMPALPGDPVDWEGMEKQYKWPAEMAATPQDPRHHAEGDVWTHTKMVTEALLSLPSFWALDATGKRVTFLSTVLHDIAKPATTKHQADGSITSIGHSRRGALDARILLWREGFPFAEREMVARIIGVHQVPFFLMKEKDNEPPEAAAEREFKLRKLSHDVRLDWLGLMAEADALGRYTQPAHAREETLENVAYFQIACESAEIATKPYPAANPESWVRYLDVKGEQCDPRYAIPNMAKGSRVIVMSGLAGMGKDDWIKKHAAHLPMISLDVMRDTMNIKRGDNQGTMAQVIKEEAKVFLRSGEPFVYNATHFTPAMREKTINQLREYGAFVTLVYVETSDEKRWRQQNRNREASVPDKALDSMLFKWEPPMENEAHVVQYWIDGELTKVIDMQYGDAPVMNY